MERSAVNAARKARILPASAAARGVQAERGHAAVKYAGAPWTMTVKRMATHETICKQRRRGGVLGVCRRAWAACADRMRFAACQPSRATRQRCPVLTGFNDDHRRHRAGAPGL